MTEYYRPDYTPEWFDLKNYEPLKDMEREGMYQVLKNKRLWAYFAILKQSADDDWIEFLGIRNSERFSIMVNDISLLASDNGQDHEKQSVKDLDFFTTADIVMSVEDSKRKDVIAFNKELSELKDASYGYDDSGYRFS